MRVTGARRLAAVLGGGGLLAAAAAGAAPNVALIGHLDTARAALAAGRAEPRFWAGFTLVGAAN